MSTATAVLVDPVSDENDFVVDEEVHNFDRSDCRIVTEP